jgi:hypothetical protein
MSRPETAAQYFVPSMPEDELQALLQALGRDSAGAKKAYRCQCGYLYFLGNCGEAWVVGQCPQCKARIGGEGHKLVATSRAVAEEELQRENSRKGYVADLISSEGSAAIGRGLTVATVRCLRLLIHSVLMVMARSNTDQARSTALCAAIKRDNQNAPTLEVAIQWLTERYLEDWSQLGKLVGDLSDESIAFLLHGMLVASNRATEGVWNTPLAQFATVNARRDWENNFQTHISGPILADGIADRIRQMQVRAQVDAALGARDGVISELKEAITESEYAVNHGTEQSVLWRYRSRVTFDGLHQQFYRNAANSVQYPLIDAVLSNEDPLSVVDSLPAIFEWHSVLFEAYPEGFLTRENAQELTNSDAVARLPANRQKHGQRVLGTYIEAFNASFRHLEMIECEDNPWRHTLTMSEETPIGFSLPSRPFNGQKLTENICTVALCDMLASRQNSVLEKFEATGLVGAGEDANRGGGGGRQQPHGGHGGHGAAAGGVGRSAIGITSVSQYMSPTILGQLLCSYKRPILMQLAYTYADQGTGIGEGKELQYDYKSIQQKLANLVLLGKTKIALNLRMYQFAGEIRQAGLLTRLDGVIKQSNGFPFGFEDRIKSELDLLIDKVPLYRQIEAAVRFLATSTVDAAGTLAQRSLDSFILSTLHVDGVFWEAISVPTIRNQLVRLEHLARVYQAIENSLRAGDDPYSRVADKYKIKLTEAQITEVDRAIFAGIDFKRLRDIVRVVLTDYLADNESLNARSPITDFLQYVDGVEEVRGYEIFPQSLLLENTHALFQLLSERHDREKARSSAGASGGSAAAAGGRRVQAQREFVGVPSAGGGPRYGR